MVYRYAKQIDMYVRLTFAFFHIEIIENQLNVRQFN